MSKPNIMVVDDEKNICELIRLYLEKEGFAVTIANNGSDAIAMIRQNRPDLVLLDIMMPVIDGWEVCRQVREFSQVPIIMLTAKGETFDKVMGLDLGADDYIVKPFDTKEVVARVKAMNCVWTERSSIPLRRNWSSSITWRRTRTTCIQGISFSMRCGDSSISETAGPSMSM